MTEWKNEDDINAELRELAAELRRLKEELRGMVEPGKSQSGKSLVSRHCSLSQIGRSVAADSRKRTPRK